MLEKDRMEIPRNDWKVFLDRFSKDHLGASVDIETRADGEHQMQASGLPLEGISADFEGTRGAAIEVAVGTEPDRELTHIVKSPSRLTHGSTDGVEEWLEIDSEDTGPTVLHFKSSANPDVVRKPTLH